MSEWLCVGVRLADRPDGQGCGTRLMEEHLFCDISLLLVHHFDTCRQLCLLWCRHVCVVFQIFSCVRFLSCDHLPYTLG